jgi:hypothetical protein
MISLHTGRIWLASKIVLAIFALSISPTSAQVDPQTKQRLEYMQSALESLEPESSELESKVAPTVASKPLLRYSDPTRGGGNLTNTKVLLDAGI